MKKIALLTVLALFTFGMTDSCGQEFRPAYYNFSYSTQKIVDEDVRSYGCAFTMGRSYVVAPRRRAGTVRFAIDATWLDLQYTRYVDPHARHDDFMGSFEVGYGVGPSLHIDLEGSLSIHTYLHLGHSLSILSLMSYDYGMVIPSFGTSVSAGGALSWEVFSLGVEARRLWSIFGLHTSDLRIYAGFRF